MLHKVKYNMPYLTKRICLWYFRKKHKMIKLRPQSSKTTIAYAQRSFWFKNVSLSAKKTLFIFYNDFLPQFYPFGFFHSIGSIQFHTWLWIFSMLLLWFFFVAHYLTPHDAPTHNTIQTKWTRILWAWFDY